MIAITIALVVAVIALTGMFTLVVLTLDDRERSGESDGFPEFERLLLAQLARIDVLENRLLAHTWTEYGQLQNDVSNTVDKVVQAWSHPPNTGASPTTENTYGYGSSPDDILEAAMASQGFDMEGPTVG